MTYATDLERKIIAALQQGHKTRGELLDSCQCNLYDQIRPPLASLQARGEVDFYFGDGGALTYYLKSQPPTSQVRAWFGH